MVFVGAHFMDTYLIKNPAVTHHRGGLDISDLKRDGKSGSPRGGRHLRNFQPIVPDRVRSAAAGGDHSQRRSDKPGPGLHLLAPPGFRSSTRIPRMRLAGLLLTVSVRLRIFDVDARTFSRMS